MCPQLREALLRVNGYVPVTEGRCREIARDEIRKELDGCNDDLYDKMCLGKPDRAETEKIRDAALEEAALQGEKMQGLIISGRDWAAEMRGLKSQAGGEAAPREPLTATEAFIEAESGLSGRLRVAREEIARLRTSLEAANGALDEIADAVKCNPRKETASDAVEACVVVERLIRNTGRLVGRLGGQVRP